MEFIFLITGLIVGMLLGYLFFRNKKETLQGISLEQYNQLDKEKAVLETRLNNANEKFTQQEQVLKTYQDENILIKERIAKAEEAFKHLKEREKTLQEEYERRVQEQKDELEKLNLRFTREFENIANRIIEEKGQKFTEQNRSNLDIILNPLKERIQAFEKKVDETFKADNAERVTLKTEIKSLVEMNKQISEEANNLARALKGDNKKQGNWGELVLERILERSGLIKGSEYRIQFSTTNSEGKLILPDVIVNLPDNKHVIIDSKVSLIAYEALVNCEKEELRDGLLKEHIRSVRDHIKNLAEKNYTSSADLHTPDFVMLFMPIESSFGLAAQADQDLFTFAWDRKIVLVSPSTLFACLRTIANIWKQERQNRNAQEIAIQGGALYDKFVGFLEDMNEIGTRIDATRKSFSNAMNKLVSGNGNLVRKAENLKDLGARANKMIPEKFLEPMALEEKMPEA